MGDFNKIQGTPWHIEKMVRGENDDKRHRAHCIHYNKKKEICYLRNSGCWGSAHCDDYATEETDTVSEQIVTTKIELSVMPKQTSILSTDNENDCSLRNNKEPPNAFVSIDEAKKLIISCRHSLNEIEKELNASLNSQYRNATLLNRVKTSLKKITDALRKIDENFVKKK